MPLAELLAAPPERTAWLVEDGSWFGRVADRGQTESGQIDPWRDAWGSRSRGARRSWGGPPPGLRVYLAFEEKASEVRAHFAAMGATAEDVRVCLAQAPEDALVQAAGHRGDRASRVDRHRHALRFVRVRDGNDYAEMSRALEAVILLARETGAHVLVVHHLGKGERSGGDAILGSTAIFATVDTALLLRRAEHYRTCRRSSGMAATWRRSPSPSTRTRGGSPRGAAGRTRTKAPRRTCSSSFCGGRKEALEESTILEEVEGRGR